MLSLHPLHHYVAIPHSSGLPVCVFVCVRAHTHVCVSHLCSLIKCVCADLCPVKTCSDGLLLQTGCCVVFLNRQEFLFYADHGNAAWFLRLNRVCP